MKYHIVIEMDEKASIDALVKAMVPVQVLPHVTNAYLVGVEHENEVDIEPCGTVSALCNSARIKYHIPAKDITQCATCEHKKHSMTGAVLDAGGIHETSKTFFCELTGFSWTEEIECLNHKQREVKQ